MALGPLAAALPRLREAADADQTTDADLLARFRSGSAAAFEALVRRHGPMVFGVCRRVLRHTQDAEDAFQATFLVLAHKAGAVSPPGALGGWLHGVARRTALKARHRAARRAAVERNAPARSADPMSTDRALDTAEVEAVLDEELAALPDRYRLPLVLCDLEGRPRADAAAALGCAEGTLSSRLTRGRRLLAERLTRRGLTVPAAALAALLAERTAIAEPLIRATLPAALAPAAGAALFPPNVTELATGVLTTMFLKKLQALALGALALAALTAAAAVAGSRPAPAAPAAAAPLAAPVPQEPAPVVDDKAVAAGLADLDGRLLLNRKVLKEIGCDIDQLDRAMDAIEAAQSRGTKLAQGALQQLNGGGAPEAVVQAVQGAKEAGDKEVRKATDEVLAKVLKPAQRRRLLEVELQSRGFEAFDAPLVAKALNLTPRQKEQLADNRREFADRLQEAVQKALAVNGPAQLDSEALVAEARRAATRRALEVLTADQRAVWGRLTGAPVRFPINRWWAENPGTALPEPANDPPGPPRAAPKIDPE